METGSESTLDLRLSTAVMEVLEQAAARSGQSVGDFAAGVLTRTAHALAAHDGETVLTPRDWDRFLTLLDEDVEPSPALKSAVARYEQHFG